MLIRDITYQDGDGNTITETFHFHLTIREFVKLIGGNESSTIEEALKELESKSIKEQVLEFDDFILSSYGVRSEDKKRFIKNDELREQFADSFAYDALFTEFVMSETAANDFIMALLPENLRGEFAKLQQSAIQAQQAQIVPLPPQAS